MGVVNPDIEILEHIHEGFQVIDREWRYLYVNRAAAEHGRRPREEILGRTMMECYPGIEETEMFQGLRRCMEGRTPERLENRFTYPDGARAWFELHVEPVPEGILILSMDVSERKALEAQLQQAQRLESIGRLAGAVAHDFNNLLTVILSVAEFVRYPLPEGDPIRDDMGQIIEAGNRATNLVRQLLAFSRRQVVDPRVISVNEQLAELDKMLRRVIGADVELSIRCAPDLWPVRIDPGALEQLVMNLAVNARDAMPGGGRLAIETANAELDEGYRMAKGGLVQPGDYVMVAVSDSGAGMDLETQSHAFEPFFTTKGEHGTGLGLATCYGIVKQAGGYIWLYSEPGSGTSFKIYLPRVRDPLAERSRKLAAPAVHGDETVLVVEDDAQVRALAVRTLADYSYRVVEAEDAGEALLILAAAEPEIDLLLTDLVMPRMSGAELARRAQALRPDLRVVFMSGYSEDAAMSNYTLEPGRHLLPKPFTPAALARKVREVLDG